MYVRTYTLRRNCVCVCVCVCVCACVHMCAHMHVYLCVFSHKQTKTIYTPPQTRPTVSKHTHIHRQTDTYTQRACTHTSADKALCLASKHATRTLAPYSSALRARAHMLSLAARARCKACAYSDAPSSVDELSSCRCFKAVLRASLSLLACIGYCVYMCVYIM